MEAKTYYEILGVSRDATNDEIKSAYRKLAKKYHPDVWHGDSAFATKKMSEINRIYSCLIDSNQRQTYDNILDFKSHQSNENRTTYEQKSNSYSQASNQHKATNKDYRTTNKDASSAEPFIFKVILVVFTLGDLYFFGTLFLMSLVLVFVLPISFAVSSNDPNWRGMTVLLEPVFIILCSMLGRHIKPTCSLIYDNIEFVHSTFEPIVIIYKSISHEFSTVYNYIRKFFSHRKSSSTNSSNHKSNRFKNITISKILISVMIVILGFSTYYMFFSDNVVITRNSDKVMDAFIAETYNEKYDMDKIQMSEPLRYGFNDDSHQMRTLGKISTRWVSKDAVAINRASTTIENQKAKVHYVISFTKRSPKFPDRSLDLYWEKNGNREWILQDIICDYNNSFSALIKHS